MRVRALGCVLWLCGVSAFAQSFTPIRELKNLSPAEIEKLHTLETLTALPTGVWRFHVGDVPHGEAVGLDDSSWQLVTPRSRTSTGKAPKDAVWYRREIEVPKTLNGYDITGARIWFQFEADANGPMPEIVYYNGRRVALGDDLEPIVLFEPAKPGDKILVAVKLLHTVDTKTWEAVHLRVELNSSAGRPDPEDVRSQCIAAANLLPSLPTPRMDLLPKVEKAIAAIDMHALAAADQPKFDASLRQAQAILAELHGSLQQAHIVEDGNSHIDAAWLWPRSETIDVVHRTFTSALQLMDEYPDYIFTQSAAQYNAWIADKYPQMNDEIRKRIQEGRWEIVGGMWVEPDLNLPGGESLVRQLLVGQRYFQKEYGVFTRIGWNPDSFGYNWQLPQIYKRSGMDYFVTQKMHWNDTNQLPFRLFWWQSPDGSKVLTYFPTDYAWTNVNLGRITADYAESAQRNPGTFETLDLYGVGDHGGGPTRAMLDQVDHEIAEGKTGNAAVPAMHYGTAQSYFSDVEKRLNPNSPVWNYDRIAQGWTAPPAGANGTIGVPTWNDELYFEYHRGVYTSQAAHKRNMRVSEQQTLNAEKLASINWLNHDSYPGDELIENWKKIAFNQFHDLAAGSGIAVIYRDAEKDFHEVALSDGDLSETALKAIAARVDTRVRDGVPVLVFNTEAWPRTETVRIHAQLPSSADSANVFDAQGRKLLSELVSMDDNHDVVLRAAVTVPALGYTVLRIAPANDKERAHDGVQLLDRGKDYELSNKFLSVVIDKASGCMTSLTTPAHPASFFAANSCANQLQFFADKPKNYDAWNVDPGTLDVAPATLDKVAGISAGIEKPLERDITVRWNWHNSTFTQDISLDADADFVRVVNHIDWHEQHVLLKAAFPLAASGPKATFEIPFGSIERPTTRNNSFENAKFEVPALRWADLGDDKQGVSILNSAKYGYDALGNVLRLTLLRSPTWPDEHADQGWQSFTYAIYPHLRSWKDAQTVRRGYDLNDPLQAEQVFAHTGELPAEFSFASVENPNVTLTAMKKAEDSDALVFRMYEWAGKATEVKLHVPKDAQYAVESNLMEKIEGGHLPMSGDVVTVPIKPYEILTVQVFYKQR